jgi:hypothetical protein
MLNLFIQAVESKQTVEFEYKGHIRTVEPHAVGVTSKGNDVVLVLPPYSRTRPIRNVAPAPLGEPGALARLGAA